MRVRLCWLIPLIWLLRTSAAAACGTWWLQDDERHQSVRFYIRSTFLIPDGHNPETPPQNRILLMEGESAQQLHTEVSGRTQLDVMNNQLRLRGRVVGELSGERLTLGRLVYQIAVAVRPEAAAHPERRENRFQVEVRRGEQLIAHGQAMAMCLGGLKGADDAQQELEVRRRVTFYLAWRELVAPRSGPARPAAAAAPQAH